MGIASMVANSGIREKHRIGFSKGDRSEGIDAKDTGTDPGTGAEEHEASSIQTEDFAPAFRLRSAEAEGRQRGHCDEEVDLEYRQAAAQRLGAGVGTGEQQIGQETEEDALDHGGRNQMGLPPP